MLNFRKANLEDIDLFFNWVNDPLARNNSYQKNQTSYSEHVVWFNEKVLNKDNYFYVFFNENEIAVGQARISIDGLNSAIISLMIDRDFRGKGYAKEMIEKSSLDFLESNKEFKLLAYIFKTNIPSYRSFINAGYELLKEEMVKNIPSYILFKTYYETEY